MKLRLFVFIGVLAALAMVVSENATAAMKFGLGYFRPEAPIGARLWFSDAVAGDLGIGFETNKLAAGDQDKTKVAFDIDLGIPIVLMGTTDKTKWFFRPGFNYRTHPSVYQDDYITPKWIAISGSLGVEHFLTDKFSVQVAHGVIWESFDSDIPDSDKENSFFTEDFGVSSIGFHYYFWSAE